MEEECMASLLTQRLQKQREASNCDKKPHFSRSKSVSVSHNTNDTSDANVLNSRYHLSIRIIGRCKNPAYMACYNAN